MPSLHLEQCQAIHIAKSLEPRFATALHCTISLPRLPPPVFRLYNTVEEAWVTDIIEAPMRAIILLATLGFIASAVVSAQDTAKTLPRNYLLAFENDLVRVVRVRYEARERLPLHDHPNRPTVYVYLTDSGPVKFTHAEEPPFSLTRRPVKMGEFRVSPGRLEEHEVENLGNIPTEFLRVELKQFPLGLQDIHFRGNKSFDLSKTGSITEFVSLRISIQRFIIAKKGDVQNFSAAQPALLVFFSPTLVQTAASPSKPVQRGDSYWLDGNQSAQIEKASDAPAHFLAITF